MTVAGPNKNTVNEPTTHIPSQDEGFTKRQKLDSGSRRPNDIVEVDSNSCVSSSTSVAPFNSVPSSNSGVSSSTNVSESLRPRITPWSLSRLDSEQAVEMYLHDLLTDSTAQGSRSQNI